MAIKIVIDSSSDISKEEASKLVIEVIPMIVSFDKEEFYDGDNLLAHQFYEKLIESDVLPKTSQITPFRFIEVFERLVKEGNDVIVITLSSKLSKLSSLISIICFLTSFWYANFNSEIYLIVK